MAQNIKAPLIACSFAYGFLQSFNCFQVVIEDVRTGIKYDIQIFKISLKSGTRTSIAVPFKWRDRARIVAAQTLAPPSGRSSRATGRKDTVAESHLATASATEEVLPNPARSVYLSALRKSCMLEYKYFPKSLRWRFLSTSIPPYLDIEHSDKQCEVGFGLRCLLPLNILVPLVTLLVTMRAWRFFLYFHSSDNLFKSISEGPNLPTLRVYLED